MSEEWRPVPSHNCYEVSSRGQVRRSAPGRGATMGRVLQQRSGWGGYPTVNLSGPTAKRFVHRLVAEAFIGPCPEGMEVNHKNSDRRDPRPENLEYVTRQQNMSHAVRAGRHNPKRGEANPQAKLTEEQVREIRASTETHRALGAKYGVSHRVIQRIKKREKWAHVPDRPGRRGQERIATGPARQP